MTPTPKKGERRIIRQHITSGQPRPYADCEDVFIAYPERFTDGEWKRQEVSLEEFKEKWLHLLLNVPCTTRQLEPWPYIDAITPERGGFRVTIITPFND